MKSIKDAQKLTDQEKAVADYLTYIKVEFVVYPAGKDLNRDGWTCDGWRVEFSKDKFREQFDYYTGIGHRVFTRPRPRGVNFKSVDYYLWERQCIIPFPPNACLVLYSLVLDSSALDQSFTNWCDEFGYDTDSLKALTIYNECCTNAKKLCTVFTRDQLSKLSELLEGY